MNKGTRKNIVSAVITLLILAAAAFLMKTLTAQKKSTVSDQVVKKERRKVAVSSYAPTSVANIIAIDGRLQAHDRVAITAKVQGVMQPTDQALRAGSFVKKGQLLFTVDSKEARYSLNAQRSSLLTAITQIMPDLKFDHPAAFTNWEKYLAAFDVERTTQPLPTPTTDQEKYFVAGKNIYSQYYTIKSLETRLADYNIYAPFSGVLTDVGVFPGALISPGQMLANMINTATYEIQAPIALEDLKYISTGQQVELQSPELGQSWKGRVSRIGTLIDAATQNIPVYISVSGQGLKDGMYLEGNLTGKPLENVTALPKEVFLSPTSIYVVRDSTLVSKTIESIKRTDDTVYVKGLGAAEKVVSGFLAGLFEGQKVDY